MSKSNIARAGCAQATPDGESPVPGLSPANWAELAKRAITPEVAIAVGVRDASDPAQKGLIVPYTGADGTVVNVYRLTDAERDKRDDGTKYLFGKGQSPPISVVRACDNTGLVLLVEGTLQPLAVASWAPADVSVHGLNGKDGWRRLDLTVYDGREVLVWPDRDVKTKRDVHDSFEALGEKLTECGATVRFVRMTASGNEGADDYLAGMDAAKRTAVIDRLIKKAGALPRKPAAKKGKVRTGSSAQCFDLDNNFLAATTTRIVLATSPAALTREGVIAMYADGVYRIDGDAFTSTVCDLLGEEYRPYYSKTIEDVAISMLRRAEAYLPEQTSAPLLNVRNGMVDLHNGALLPHDPKYLSGVQLPVAYDPAATCPTYDQWIKDVCPDQVEDLEEVCSQMLDLSRCPTKAVFNYGPSRSGKSTHLRLLDALAGPHRAAVTLHQLCTDRFASANVFGAVLNTAADLSSAHIEDLSIFKMLTGEDSVQANRKHGRQFAFRNQALFAFSANELPTVGENSTAYSERIKPFHFSRSFAGRDDPSIEARMMGELPGILNRLVAGWQRRAARTPAGSFQPTRAEVLADFEAKSCRVRLWVAEQMTVTCLETPLVPGQYVPFCLMNTRRHLAQLFNVAAREKNESPMGERKIIKRLTRVDGVVDVRSEGGGVRGFNIIQRPDDADDPVDTAGNPGGLGSFNPLPHAREDTLEDQVGFPRASSSEPFLPELPDLPGPNPYAR